MNYRKFYAALDSGLNFSDHCFVRYCVHIKLVQKMMLTDHIEHGKDILYSSIWDCDDIVNYKNQVIKSLASQIQYCPECQFPCAHSARKCDINNLFDKLVLTLKEAAITSVITRWLNKTVLV